MSTFQWVFTLVLSVGGLLIALFSCRRAGKLIIKVGDRNDPAIKSKVETMCVSCFYGLMMMIAGVVCGLIFWFKL